MYGPSVSTYVRVSLYSFFLLFPFFVASSSRSTPVLACGVRPLMHANWGRCFFPLDSRSGTRTTDGEQEYSRARSISRVCQSTRPAFCLLCNLQLAKAKRVPFLLSFFRGSLTAGPRPPQPYKCLAGFLVSRSPVG